MIHLLDLTTFSKRKLWILSCFCLISILLVIYLEYTSLLELNQSHALSLKILGIMMGFVITWITLDMTHPYEVMIISYTGKKYLEIHKFINMIFWSFLITLIVFLIFTIVRFISIRYYPTKQDITMYLHFLLDLVIIGTVVIKLYKIKHPTLIFIIPTTYVFYQLIAEIKPSITLYYLIPFFNL